MKDYERWFKKAENDLLAIKNNLAAENIPADTCCFHVQQAPEKYLKAYLYFTPDKFVRCVLRVGTSRHNVGTV